MTTSDPPVEGPAPRPGTPPTSSTQPASQKRTDTARCRCRILDQKLHKLQPLQLDRLGSRCSDGAWLTVVATSVSSGRGPGGRRPFALERWLRECPPAGLCSNAAGYG